ncbi:DUF6221 family protein [Streptomyces sp. NPDC057596]|uniref:DUF6221 family protein n=1 Tax=Streptomyces sp. NPDC057596 TaxID=3346178 RepID=UPI0036C8B8D9
MDDLVPWLVAQLDEDERNAKAWRGIFPSPGVDDDGTVWLHVRPGGNAVIVRYRDPVAGYDDMATLRNWAGDKGGWTQEQVLREIDAKRQLVKLHGRAVLRAGGGAQHFATATVCRSCEPDLQFPELSWPCTTLRLLALPYADRPGYREEWRP